MNNKVVKEKKTECDVCPIKDAEEYDANCRKHLKDVMKPAEKAVKELADKTASEKARLQGTKETKAPNLKPYTEEFNVKNRAELGQLIEKARKENLPWKINRCSEELAKQGYRYTFYTTRERTNTVLEGYANQVKTPKLVLSEDVDFEVLPPEEDAAPEEAPAEINPIDVFAKYLGFSGDEETNTISICLNQNPEDEEECACISFAVEPEEFAALAPMFTTKQADEPEAPVEESLKESKEEPKLETFEEQMDFLSADEQEAIDGYEKVLGLVEDEHVKDQLNKILEEERAHKDFLEAVKADPSLEYSHEHAEDEAPVDELVDIELPAEGGLDFEITEDLDDDLEDYVDTDIECERIANSGKITVDQAIDWIFEHDQLGSDFEWAFGYNPEEDFEGEMSKPELEEVLNWLAQHDQAWEDFKSFFKLEVREEGEENLDEASSAEKKAYRNGGEDYQDYIDGKAIARVKDPEERAMLLHQKRMEKKGKKMSDRPEVNQTLDRKVQQATKAFDKKQASMAKAGVSEEQQLAEEIEISKQDYEKLLNGSTFQGKPTFGKQLKAENNKYFWLGDEKSLEAAHRYLKPLDLESAECKNGECEQQLNEEPMDEAVNIRLDDLKLFNPWGGAKDTWNLIMDQGKLEALEKALEDMYPDGIAGTELNDLLWFEQEWVFDKLDINPADLLKAKGDDIIDGEAEIVDVED